MVDITEEDNDGLLSTTTANELADKISDEMRLFSKRLIERKEKERIQDLANTSQLPGRQRNPEQASMISHEGRGRVGSFNDQEDSLLGKKREELL